MRIAELDAVIRHVYSEPKFVAQVKFWEVCPSPMTQILGQLPPGAAEDFVAGRGWPEDVANQRVSFVEYEQIDFDWWEPRHDAPWRRQDARDRGESA